MRTGNPANMQALFKSAKKMEEEKNIKPVKISTPITASVMEGGAYNSIKRNAYNNSSDVLTSAENNKVDSKSRVIAISLKERLLNGVQTVGETKEYFNAVVDLFTLYTMGEVTEDVIKSLKYEDIKEIKSIVREFKSFLDEV